ncbi:MAG: hypothetical protein SF053_21675 [Bacteroidia bacterium]|nr:hypothetical protein [Bacteroidia bacterium]
MIGSGSVTEGRNIPGFYLSGSGLNLRLVASGVVAGIFSLGMETGLLVINHQTMKNALIILTLAIALVSCEILNICQDEPLSLERVPYTTAELRTDGYYYSVRRYGKPNQGTEQPIYYYCFFFRDGTMQTDAIDSLYAVFPYRLAESKIGWGVFHMQDSLITVEYWQVLGQCGYWATTEAGIILSDTSFLLNNNVSRRRKEIVDITALSDTFFFKHSLPKPDSTNPYIE